MYKFQEKKNRYFVGSYRHAMPYPRKNLYFAVRELLNIPQAKAAKVFGVTVPAWRYRERTKRLYHTAEILALFEMSMLSNRDFIQLLRDCA